MQILIVDDVVLRCSADATADAVSICFQEVEGCVGGFSAVTVAAKTCALKLSAARQHLAFQPEHTDHAAFSTRNSVDLSWIAHSIRDQLTATLFGNRHKLFFKGIQINVAEIHIIELHATQLFQLLFHTTAHFQCKDKDLLQLLFGKLTVRVQQLYIAAYDLTHCDRITLIQIFTKAEILI